MRVLVLFFILPIFYLQTNGQISFGGSPRLRACEPEQPEQMIPFVEMPSFDMTAELKYDSLKRNSLRFAHPFFVHLSTDNAGKWWQMADGSLIWRLGIRSKNAFSINLIFDRFNLPPSGRLYIYNTNQTHVIGSFTRESHKGKGAFATEPVSGDEIIVEYIQEKGHERKPEILIGAVNHDFRGIFNLTQVKAGYFGDADICHNDITCISPGFIQSQSVCRLVVDGTELCTGTLMNNTRQDGTPYLLTAGHCLNDMLQEHSFLCFFNYEVPKCIHEIEGYKSQSLSGAQIKARADTLDFILLELDQIPPATYRPYWAGWNLTLYPEAPVYAIHHPMGDVKKFSRCVNEPTRSSFFLKEFMPDSHWRVDEWKTGSTEGGSSGCALFDEDGKVIGSLSGGSANCDKPLNDHFIRLNKVWDYFNHPDSQLVTWLDPGLTGTMSIEGFDFYNNTQPVRLSRYQDHDQVLFRDPDNPSIGSWLGHNTLKTQAFAERFENIDSALLYGVYLMAGISDKSSTQEMRMRIWSEKLFSQEEGALFDTTLQVSHIKAKSENLILLPQPLKVKYPFSISIDINYYSKPDSLAFYWLQSTSREFNTLYIKKDGLWSPFDKLHPQSANGSAYIDLLATQIGLRDSGEVEEPSERITCYPIPAADKLHFTWGIDALEMVEVYDLSGKKLHSERFGYSYSTEFIPVSHLSSGLYFFQFRFKGFTKVVKVNVMH